MRHALVAIAFGLAAAHCGSVPLDDLSFACRRDDQCARGTRCHPVDHLCSAPACGDGALDPDEACDDANTLDGDGCSALCAVEVGARCTGQPSRCSVCGDGLRAEIEACDDGDLEDGDGCDRDCRVEPGYTCDARGCVRCGDGVRTRGEACDDGEQSGGCTDCRVQFGYVCTGTIGEASRCTSRHFRAIAAGFHHTCGIDDAGSVHCTGANVYSPTDPRITGQATPPADLPPLSAISAGNVHTCGIGAADQRAICWGANFVVFDEGERTVFQATVPDDLGPVRELVAGNLNSCAVRTDGAIRCWGDNGSGQSTPVPNTPSFSVSTGSYHTCAIRSSDRRAYCFGMGDARLSAPDAAYQTLVVGLFHTCGVLEDGSLRCWGREGIPTKRSTPPPGTDFSAVVAGHYYSCALRRSGRASCFGEDLIASVLAAPSDTFTQLAGGLSHVCGLRADGSVRCWGEPAAFTE